MTEQDEESEGLILSIGEDGKASIHKPEDYVEMHKDDAELLKGFIDKYRDLFEKYVTENRTQVASSSSASQTSVIPLIKCNNTQQ